MSIHRLAFAMLLVGCSTTNVFEIASDAGAVDAESATTDAGASPDVAVGDAGASDGAVVDADSCEYHYGPPPVATGFAIFGDGVPCVSGCGAGGPYYYVTNNPTLRPDIQGCTQQLATNGTDEPTGAFCCPTLVCTRLPTFDAFCPTSNPGFPKGYLCDGPDAEPKPTRANCQVYAPAGNAQPPTFCCVN